MKHYPLLFSHGGLVAGKGFIARVTIRGRCLLEETAADFFCIFGVNPGAVAGDGSTPTEAHRDFLERIRAVVFDIASEAADFEEFEERVTQFFTEANRPNEEEWREAVAQVRAGTLDHEGYQKQDADSQVGIVVRRVVVEGEFEPIEVDTLLPSLNEPPANDQELLVATG